MIRTVWYKIRGTILAFFWLFRHYAIPLLAFLFVIGVVMFVAGAF